MEASTSLWQAPHGNKQPPVRSAGWWARKTSGIIQSTSQGPRTQAPMSATGKDRCPSSVEGHLPSVHHLFYSRPSTIGDAGEGRPFTQSAEAHVTLSQDTPAPWHTLQWCFPSALDSPVSHQLDTQHQSSPTPLFVLLITKSYNFFHQIFVENKLLIFLSSFILIK